MELEGKHAMGKDVEEEDAENQDVKKKYVEMEDLKGGGCRRTIMVEKREPDG